MWAAEPGGPAARTQAVLAVDGKVDRSAVEDALRLAVRRHESMRTTFVRRPDLTLPLQVVNELLDPRIETLDLADADPRERAERTTHVLQSELVVSNVNGEPGLCIYDGGKLTATISIATDGVHILNVFAVVNPDKLG